MLSLMRTICNVEKRLPALRSPAAGAELEFWHPGAQRKLVESQTARLHELRRELLGGLTALLESSRGMRRAVAQAEQSLTPDLRRSPVALTRATAPLPSLADCLQALRDMRCGALWSRGLRGEVAACWINSNVPFFLISAWSTRLNFLRSKQSWRRWRAAR